MPTTRTLVAQELRIGQVVALADASGPLGRFVVQGNPVRRSMPIEAPVFTNVNVIQSAVAIDGRIMTRDGRELRVELVKEPEFN